MEIRKLLQSEDQRAVSPVIGVILMVAITVILAAVIGTFVLGLGENIQDTAPTTTMSFSDASDGYGSNTDALTISHDGGDSLPYADTKVVVRSDSDNQVIATFDQGWDSASDLTLYRNGADWTSSTSDFTTGDTLTINDSDGTTDTDLSGDLKVQVVHKPSDATVSSASVTVS